MRIAFISRSTLYTSPGGDTRQMEKTAYYLKQKGVEVDIFLTTDTIVYSQYDLLHFFNIIRPADILHHIKASKLPYVVSTIFVDYSLVKDNEKNLLKKILKKIFRENSFEYVKVIARAIVNGEKIMSRRYLLMGHNNSIRYIARKASMLLPNSESEYNRVEKVLGVSNRYVVVPNGVDEEAVNKKYPENTMYKNAVICMARIEGLKNQLTLIHALNDTRYNLYIHGKPSVNNKHYYNECKKHAAANVHILPFLQGDELYTAYSNAKVHILPSYFETTGLSSLEAAVMGCNIVITDRGDTWDYFGNNAWYCEPGDAASIKTAVDKAFEAPYNEKFRDYILQHYTWEQAAVQTLKAYHQVLNKD